MRKITFGTNKYACAKYFQKVKANQSISFKIMTITKDGWTIFYEK